MKYERGRSINKVRINRNLNSKTKSIQFGAQNDNLQESHVISSRTLKRGSPYLSQDEVNIGTALKFKITQKEGRCVRVIATSHEKVDADVSREHMSRAYIKKVKDYIHVDDDDDEEEEDRVTCSVGSCSINSYNDYNIQSKSKALEDSRTYSSDAESTCQVGYEDEIHQLELQAYRCTIEALHASGPLTWEKETMAQSCRAGNSEPA